MTAKRETEISSEQHFLLNMGHGPPNVPSSEQRVLLNMGHGPPNVPSNNPVFNSHGNQDHHQIANGIAHEHFLPRAIGSGVPPTHLWGREEELMNEQDLQKELRKRDQLIQVYRDELQKSKAEKKELEEQIKSCLELKEKGNNEMRAGNRNQDARGRDIGLMTSLPYDPTRFDINLMPSEEPELLSKEQCPADDEAAMMKSIQCSEASVEQPVDLPVIKEEEKSPRHDDPGSQKKGGSSTPSSSSSFEVVGEASHLNFAKRRDLENLTSRLNELEHRLAMKDQEIAKLQNDIKELAHQKCQCTAALAAKSPEDHQESFRQLNETLQVLMRDLEYLKRPDQARQQLQDSNWQLIDNIQVLMREMESLRRPGQERYPLQQPMGGFDQQEVAREREKRRAVETILEIKDQKLTEAEARYRELEYELAKQQSRLDDSELAAENNLLKHQIETYKEDFEVERKDRERLTAQKNSLQQCFETLRTELGVARSQARAFEDEVHQLRNENDSIRGRLREATEELERLKDQRQPRMAAAAAAATTTPARQNFFPSSQLAASASSAVQSDWECKACTYKNPAPRTFCEMCGTKVSEPSRPSSTQQVPTSNYVPNIPVTAGNWQRSQWNSTPPTRSSSELLPNLRNYGDIETDGDLETD